MSRKGWIFLILTLALMSFGLCRALLKREPVPTLPAEAKEREALRRFWDSYREAGRKRSAGQFAEAISFYQQALALRPDHEDSLYYLGNCYFELARYSSAIENYQRLVAVNPKGSSRGYMQLGLIYASLEPGAPLDLAKASEYFEQTLAVDPDSGALLGRGEVAILQGKWEQAWKLLKEANADNAMSVAAPFLLGYLCDRKGQSKEAWQWFRLAVQRGEMKKLPVKWTEEGDLKADPELRWKALAKQSVFGQLWLPVRKYLKAPDFSAADMKQEYQRVDEALARAARVLREAKRG